MNTKVTMAQITSITVSGVAPNNIVPSFSSVANRSSGNEKASQGDLLAAIFRRIMPSGGGAKMRFEKFSFGSIRIDGVTHEHDVVIDRGTVRKRKKKPSKKFRDAFGHTPLPWRKRFRGNAVGS